MTGKKARQMIRSGQWDRPTPGLASGYAQANLVALPATYAFDFLLFCQRNPKACPVLDVCEAGAVHPKYTAPEADLRTDVPRYYVYRQGQLVHTPVQVRDVWRQDLVSFILGCSFTFEAAMLQANIPVRHIEEGKNVPMYVTNRSCRTAGVFAGPLVVSMRPIPRQQVEQAIAVTAEYPLVHGAPVHVGAPERLGIDLNKPDFGDAVTVGKDEVPLFWACGVTSQTAVMQAKLELVITHAPGHMLILDRSDEEIGDIYEARATVCPH